MKLQKVKIKNFRGYGEADNVDGFFEFDFLDNDVVIFNGFNGFGKTSFFEAIEWCLTDRITRLDSLKREVYDVPTLKQSHYLKFFPANTSRENANNRIIEVELIFNNKLIVRRTSNCNYARVSNNDRYQSTLTIQVGSEEKITYVCDSAENCKEASDQLAKYFINKVEPKWEEQIISAHFLGQESIIQFLRSNRPIERRSALMRLLNLNEIETIFEKSSVIKTSRRVNNLIDDLDTEIKGTKSQLVKIKELFSLLGFGSIDEYLEELSGRYDQLRFIIDEFELTGLDKDVIPSGKLKIEECIDYFSRLNVIKSVVVQEEQKLITERQNITHIINQVKQIIFLENRTDLEVKKSQLEFLLNVDVKDLEEKRNEYEQTLSILDKEYQSYSTKLKILESLRVPYKHQLEIFLEISPPRISDGFWSWYYDESVYLEEKCSSIMTVDGDSFQFKLNIDIDELKREYFSFKQELSEVGSERTRLENQYRMLSELNLDYTGILEQVKNHIIEHRYEITQCPVCLNSDFSSIIYQEIINMGDSTAGKLIKIIDYTISSGNEKTSALLSNLNNLKKREMEIKESIRKIVSLLRREIGQFITRFEAERKRILDNTRVNLTSIIERRTELYRRREEVRLSLQNYRDNAKKILETNISDVDISNDATSLFSLILSKTIESINEWNRDAVNRSLFTVMPSAEEVNAKIRVLKENENILRYYEDQSLADKEIADYSERINRISRLKNGVENVLALRIPEEQEELLRSYVDNQNETIEKQKKLEELKLYQNQSILIYENAYSLQQELIEEHLSKNNLINWIYKQINPHPFFNEIKLEERNRGINIKNSSGEVFLDHIFSSAQLNILALSVFLGIGLNQQFSKWKQLFLDDPIQNMDDVKILSFIDLLRAIMDSKIRSKNLVISTHDDNFAKLLSIKFRNKSYTQYNFTGYEKEGPVFEVVNN